jgi:thiol:disulfide interchange protein DsbC
LYEVRVDGTEIFYTDAKADFLIEGSLIDTRTKRNLTEERVEKLTAIKFDSLPLKDAFTVVRGNGERKMAVFEDPNCGYCKRFERDLQKVDNVTIYMFLYPILGADSVEKSKAIWCAKEPGKSWLDWMVRDQSPASASCDTAALKPLSSFRMVERSLPLSSSIGSC